MRRIRTILFFVTVVASIAVLLLTGCQERNKRRSARKEPEFHIPAPIDTSKMDEEFYRRMREFEALHPDAPLDR